MNQDCTTYRNPLRRDGTSQNQRLLEALGPDFVRVDEREIQDWLLYARKYARLVRFYNQQNQPDGDWVTFIENDISTLVSMVAETSVDPYKKKFEQFVSDAEKAIGQPENSAAAFAGMLVTLFEMADKLFLWYQKSIPTLSLHKKLDRLIHSKLDYSFAATLLWLKEAKSIGLPLKEAGLPDINTDRLTRAWPNGDFPLEEKPFLWGIPETKRQIYRETVKLENLFRGFYEAMISLVKQAPEFLEETFTSYPEHEPHIALFLAFLNLMKIARNHMNSLTKRHLDFYYKEILQLKNRPEDPDEVHIILSLANNFENHLITLDTTFDAGPDGSGADRIYAANEEIVVNRAIIDPEVGLRTLFLNKIFEPAPDASTDPGIALTDFSVENIYAAADADSADGKGEELPKDFPTWELMGSEKMPFAEVGFAIASPMLLLGEGTRTVRLVFQFRNMAETVSKYGRSRIKSELGNNVKIYLTGEKEWITVENRTVDILTDIVFPSETPGSEETLGEIIFELSLGVEVPPVVPYSEEVHKRGLDARFPVALFIFDNEGLSTLGDLDLNLRGGVAVYASDAEYLKGEFVLHSDSVYKANADVIGISPEDSGAYLWSRIDIENPQPWLAKDPAKELPYQSGDIVSYSSEKFRANAKVWDLNPTVEVKIWESGPLGNIGFDPAKTYVAGEFVSYENWLFQAKTIIDAIAPSLSSSWKTPPVYPTDKTSFVKGEITLFQSSPFILRADTASNIEPESGADINIWQQIEDYQPSPAQLYKVGDVVRFDFSFYRARAGSKGIAPGSGNGWKEKDGFSPGTDYKTNHEVVFKEKLYKATSDNQGISPDGSAGLWGEVSNYNASQLYMSGGTSVLQNKLYQATSLSLNASPNNSGSSWVEKSAWLATQTYSPSTDVIFSGNLYRAAFLSKGVKPDGSSNSWVEIPVWTANPLNPYQVGDEVNHFGFLYTADAIQSGIEPTSSSNGWALIPAYSSGVFYNFGDRIRHGGVIYQAKIMGFLVAPTGTPGDPFWQQVISIATLAVYDSATLYNSGQMIQYNGGSGFLPYLSTAKTQNIKPDHSAPVWSLVSIVNLYNDNTEYQTGNLVRIFQGIPNMNRFFKATANVTGDHPINLNFPWVNISTSVPEYLASAQYAVGDDVKVTISPGNARFFRAAEISIGDHPAQLSSPWSDITSSVNAWSSSTAYTPNSTVKVVQSSTTRYFTAILASKGADPTGATNPWTDISATIALYDNTKEYAPENHVKVQDSGTGLLKFFRADGYTLGSYPVNATDIWNKESSVLSAWNLSTSYPEAQLVEEGELAYQSRVKNTGISPSSGARIWKKLNAPDYSEFNVLAYDAERSFLNGDYAVYEGLIYQVNNVSGITGTELAPILNPAWEKKSSLAEFDARAEYPADTFVRFRGKIYRSQALTRGVPPNSGLLVWEKIDMTAIEEYTSAQVYSPGDYVFSGGVVFRANAGIAGTNPPTLDPEDEPWKRIGSFASAKDYFPGDHVWIGGSVYRCELPVSGTKPGSGTAWVEVLDIPDYDSTFVYEAGTVVYFFEKYYLATAPTTGDQPGQNFSLWEETTRINSFNGIERFLPGEYVRYGRNIYRALTTVVGDDPENSPELWQIIGAIPVYNSEKTYFQYSHVLSAGKVYVAMKNTQGLSPESDTTQSVWRPVLYSYPYKFFRNPEIYKFEVSVNVTGIQNLILENDEGTIAPGKPFFPFGSAPKVGGNFYIGSYEVFSKAPSNVNIQLEWGDLPILGNVLDFKAHYANYADSLFDEDDPKRLSVADKGDTSSSPVGSNSHFQAGINLLLSGNWRTFGEVNSPITDPAVPIELFPSTVSTPTQTDQLRNFHSVSMDFPVVFDRLNFKRDPNLAPFTAFRNGMSRGFLQFRLLKDFFHADFPRFVAKAAIKQKVESFPNAPYTPLVNRITLNYSASETLNFSVKSSADFSTRVERFFHIHPFGHAEFFPVKETPSDQVFTSPLLVPIFETKILNPEDTIPPTAEQQYVDATGNLFIGLRNLDLPQNLSILFQVTEGSENPAHAGQRMVWSYLSYNRWKYFDPSQILGDTTRHLLTSGIIKFSLPKDMTDQNTLLPGGGLFWIRGSVVNYADGIAKGLKVLPQALLAGYRKQPENDPKHLATVLPAGSITDLIIRQSAISEVSQPFSSFGGRLAETDEHFYTRVSERLRHKNRGITIWDYERLVLEQFPDIHRAKCINHGKPGNELVAGNVHLVVIPNLQNKNAANRLKPVVSVNRRNEIRDFLKTRVSDFAEVVVQSPVYEEIRLKAEVKFARGKDIGFYSAQILKDVIRFMAPWLYDTAAELSFTNEITPAALLNFIDEQQYVDYVRNFRLEYRRDENSLWEKVTGEKITASIASAVLVPAPENLHEIHPIEEEKCQITTSF
ncbi:MAG: baseplate J/gp47 family protein [Bacteroidia bacterium]|nr:baseplate J/gp47 family protein [Bacteroidia bacterium]